MKQEYLSVIDYIAALPGLWQVAAYAFLILLVIGLIRALPLIVEFLWYVTQDAFAFALKYLWYAIRYVVLLAFRLITILWWRILATVGLQAKRKKIQGPQLYDEYGDLLRASVIAPPHRSLPAEDKPEPDAKPIGDPFRELDYRPDELFEIFLKICEDEKYSLTPMAKIKVLLKIEKIHDERGQSFINARAMRNLFDECLTRQAKRILALGTQAPEDLIILDSEDVPDIEENS